MTLIIIWTKTLIIQLITSEANFIFKSSLSDFDSNEIFNKNVLKT
jgi:hypothetical protein